MNEETDLLERLGAELCSCGARAMKNGMCWEHYAGHLEEDLEEKRNALTRADLALVNLQQIIQDLKHPKTYTWSTNSSNGTGIPPYQPTIHIRNNTK